MAGGTTPETTRVIIGIALVEMAIVGAGLACSRDATHSTTPAVASPPPIATPAPLAPATPPASTAPGRHTQLTGRRTEALCTSLADVGRFYDASRDQTQDGLSCSLILAGKHTADVIVFESHGPYVRVRLSDNTGRYSDGYMRSDAVR